MRHHPRDQRQSVAGPASPLTLVDWDETRNDGLFMHGSQELATEFLIIGHASLTLMRSASVVLRRNLGVSQARHLFRFELCEPALLHPGQREQQRA
jgi:hypothetical protein